MPRELLSALVRAANEAANDLRLAESRDAWMQVWRFRRDHVATCNIGELSLSVGDLPRAAQFLSACVREIPRNGEFSEQDKIHVLSLARARQRVGEVVLRAPDGAEITIDGIPFGTVPLDHEVFLEPGPHRIRAALLDRSGEATVEVLAGGSHRVTLDPLSAAPVVLAAQVSPVLIAVVIVVAAVSFSLGLLLARRRARAASGAQPAAPPNGRKVTACAPTKTSAPTLRSPVRVTSGTRCGSEA